MKIEGRVTRKKRRCKTRCPYNVICVVPVPHGYPPVEVKNPMVGSVACDHCKYFFSKKKKVHTVIVKCTHISKKKKKSAKRQWSVYG